MEGGYGAAFGAKEEHCAPGIDGGAGLREAQTAGERLAGGSRGAEESGVASVKCVRVRNASAEHNGGRSCGGTARALRHRRRVAAQQKALAREECLRQCLFGCLHSPKRGQEARDATFILSLCSGLGTRVLVGFADRHERVGQAAEARLGHRTVDARDLSEEDKLSARRLIDLTAVDVVVCSIGRRDDNKLWRKVQRHLIEALEESELRR